MPDFATIRDARGSEGRESDGNHEFIPEAAGRFDDNVPREEITRRVTELIVDAGLEDDKETFKRGAWLAHDPVRFYTSDASEDENKSLLCEAVNRFRQPFAIWWVSIVNALAATVQGIDETVISGAQLYFLKYFGIENNALLTGLINASPYLMCATRHAAAFQSLLQLRATKLQAARDLYYIVQSVKLEEDLRSGRTLFSDIRDVVQLPRVRYAALASWFIMFMQNFCGINAMTYYTGQVFVDTGATAVTAIYASIGALPAIKYIDIWGRRPLLPIFFIPETRGKSLEELDMVFAVPISVHGANKLHQLRYWLGLSSDRPRDMEDIMRENNLRVSAPRGVNDEEKMSDDIKQVEQAEHIMPPNTI
ncbi:hypothetical protein CDV55_102326 [Aspergillus turcosus]|nr:hypothetical protein CDV55_102326 [Aspergillus turcosus]